MFKSLGMLKLFGSLKLLKITNKIIALSCLVLCACAGSRDSAETPAPEKPKHFLWKVSDDNSSVWILGSVHFADSTFYPLDSVIETAFVNAEELAVEIDVSNDSVSSEVAEQSTRQGMLPEGETLQNLLPEATWNSFDSICTAWNVPSANFQRLRPWLAAMTISSVAIQRSGIDPNLGIDVVLLDRAATDGKAIVGLETADEQISAVADTDDSDSAGVYYLQTTLREISELDSMVAWVLRAWKTGDDELLRLVMNDEDDDDCEDCDSVAAQKFKDELEQKIYTNRNAKMAEKIAAFLAEDRNVFVVVGAAHLALDKDNVIERLRARGLKVERF